MKRWIAAGLLSCSVGLAPTRALAGCFLCPCSQAVFDDVGTCNGNCRVTLACFNNICGPWRPADEPTLAQDLMQRYVLFENLSDCYGVTDQPTDTYNCIAWSAGDDSKWIWWEVDSPFGNEDGYVQVSDFDSFYEFGGYTPSASCAQEDGKEKVALYGKPTTDPNYPDGWQPTHAARQPSSRSLAATGGKAKRENTSASSIA